MSRRSCSRKPEAVEEQHTFEVFNVPNTSTSTSRNYQPKVEQEQEQEQALEVWTPPNNNCRDLPWEIGNKTAGTSNDNLSINDMLGYSIQYNWTAGIPPSSDITNTLFTQTPVKNSPNVMVKTTSNKQRPVAFRKPKCSTPELDQEDEKEEAEENVYENVAVDRTSIIYENIITRIIYKRKKN